MGLIGNPSSVLLTTHEMSTKQFGEFKSGWIKYEAIKLQRDGVSKSVAERTASDEFSLLEKTGFKEVNEVTLRNRGVRCSTLTSS